jgi:ribosomal protein S18 acetylase RimI-like enzyme
MQEPNPLAPFPRREGGTGVRWESYLPSPVRRGVGGEVLKEYGLQTQLTALIADFARRKTGQEPLRLDVRAADVRAGDPWHVDAAFSLAGRGDFRIRNLGSDDLPLLLAFADGLGAFSKEMFCPYPWGDPVGLVVGFRETIANAVACRDASYLLLDESDGTPRAIGHFFLWAAGGNPQSQAWGLHVPDAGIAFADAYHGQGWGGLAMRVLQAAAADVKADAIELTTAQNNEPGFRTYSSVGFEYVGILRIPLGIEGTDDKGVPLAWRDERHMVYVLNPAQRETVLRYLAAKRGEQVERESNASR